jgi:hypothetical protein
LQVIGQGGAKRCFKFLIPTLRDILVRARRYGYEYDSSAASAVVSLVEKFVATQRGLLQQNEDCRAALVEILDVLLHVGWPSAKPPPIQLTG